MSIRIAQLLDVIEEVKEEYIRQLSNHSKKSIRSLRLDAVNSVAFRRSVEHTTIYDKFMRGLRPEVKSTREFDRLLEDWLLNESEELKNILLSHTIHSSDKNRIENAFHVATDTEILISQEFEINPNEQSFEEGKSKLRLHLSKERNNYLVKEAKKKWLKESNGNLYCTICSFSFQNTYGFYGHNFIEAHHKKAISLLTENELVSISDLAPVCSNCHRILHRTKPYLAIEQLKDIFIEQQNKNKS